MNAVLAYPSTDIGRDVVGYSIDINSDDSEARRCSGTIQSRTAIYGFMDEGKRQTKNDRPKESRDRQDR